MSEVRLSKENISDIADKLNKKVNVPILGEKAEKAILVGIINQIDNYLHAKLPGAIYALARDSADGISEEEAETIKRRVSKKINNEIDIPFLSEAKEEKLINMVLDVITESLQKNKSVKTALAAF